MYTICSVSHAAVWCEGPVQVFKLLDLSVLFYSRVPQWGVLAAFSCEMEESLSGARLWLGLWGAFGFRRMRIVKEVEQCLVSVPLGGLHSWQ